MGHPHKPHAKETLVLSKHFGEADARTYKGWVKRGGYEMLAQALTMEPARAIDIVKESGLRGRGGAGFPTGLKWSFMPKEKKKPHYLCVNADESEPGTFKDRHLNRRRRVRHADHDQQRRDARRRAPHSQKGGALVQRTVTRVPEKHRHQAVLRVRPRAATGQLRSHDGLPAQGPAL